jgi:hypothetical protein
MGAAEELALLRIRARATQLGSASVEVFQAFVTIDGFPTPAVFAPTTVASHAKTVKIALIALVANRFEASLVGIAPPANGDLAGRFAVPAEGFMTTGAAEPEK